MATMSSCSLNGRLPQAGKYSERLLVMVGSCRALNTWSADSLWLARVPACDLAHGDVPLTPAQARNAQSCTCRFWETQHMGHGNVYLVYMMCRPLLSVQMKPVNKLQDNMSNQRLQVISLGKGLIQHL